MTMQGLDDLVAAGRVSAADAEACRVLNAHPRVTGATVEISRSGGALIEYVDVADGQRRSLRGHTAGDVARYLMAGLDRRESDEWVARLAPITTEPTAQPDPLLCPRCSTPSHPVALRTRGETRTHVWQCGCVIAPETRRAPEPLRATPREMAIGCLWSVSGHGVSTTHPTEAGAIAAWRLALEQRQREDDERAAHTAASMRDVFEMSDAQAQALIDREIERGIIGVDLASAPDLMATTAIGTGREVFGYALADSTPDPKDPTRHTVEVAVGASLRVTGATAIDSKGHRTTLSFAIDAPEASDIDAAMRSLMERREQRAAEDLMRQSAYAHETLLLGRLPECSDDDLRWVASRCTEATHIETLVAVANECARRWPARLGGQFSVLPSANFHAAVWEGCLGMSTLHPGEIADLIQQAARVP